MEFLTVGTVLKPQGIRGEVKIKIYMDTAEEFKKLKQVYISGEKYAVLNVRTLGEFAFVALRGVADRNAAELLRGKDVDALKEDCPPLPEGRYYIGDLIGCALLGSDGGRLGVITAVTPARTDIFTLTDEKGKEISFAAAEGVILSVDTDNKIITVDKKRFKEVSV